MNAERRYAWRYLIKGDAKFYWRKRRFVAGIRSILIRIVFGDNGETCQDCGRRYRWSNWVAPDSLYRLVHGNNQGTLCPRCFSKQAGENVGLRIVWVPIIEETSTHERVMTGDLSG